MRPRDGQRSKVYAAEAVAWGSPNAPRHGRTFDSIAEIQTYVDKLTGSAWYQRRWRGTRIEVHPKQRGHAQGGPRGIYLPRWSWNEPVVLHEVAHVIVMRYENGRDDDGTWIEHPFHGWAFCRVYLELVGHKMGKDAAARLRRAFVSLKVRHRKPRTLTPTQRAEASARLVAARAKMEMKK